MIGSWQVRQRIAAQNRRFVRIDKQSQDNKLTRAEDRKGLPVDWPQKEGSDAIAFLTNLPDSHLSKSGPCWSLLFICESRIPRHGLRARLLLEYRLERTLPALAKR